MVLITTNKIVVVGEITDEQYQLVEADIGLQPGSGEPVRLSDAEWSVDLISSFGIEFLHVYHDSDDEGKAALSASWYPLAKASSYLIPVTEMIDDECQPEKGAIKWVVEQHLLRDEATVPAVILQKSVFKTKGRWTFPIWREYLPEGTRFYAFSADGSMHMM